MLARFFQLIRFLGKIIQEPNNFDKHWELFRLSRLPRHTPTRTNLLGPELIVPDARSFLSAYREIFEHEIYRFESGADTPRIIDCGANIGLSVIYFKRLFPKAKIIAFEPDPVLFAILEKNIAACGFTGVTLIKKAIAAAEGTLSFTPDGADGGHLTADTTPGTMMKVSTTTLDQYLNEPADLLKIDIEGAEHEVLPAIAEKLPNVRCLFVEYHSLPGRQQTLDEILRIIRTAGFRYTISMSGTPPKQPLQPRTKKTDMEFQLNIFASR